MRQKGLVPIIVLLLVLVVGTAIGGYFYLDWQQARIAKDLESSSAAKTPVQVQDLSTYKGRINDGEIYYIKGDKLYVLNTTTMEPDEVTLRGNEGDLSDLSISDNGKYLFVTSTGDKQNLIVYNLINKKQISVEMGERPNPRVDPEEVSPNDMYFLVTSACCPGDVGYTVTTIDGKVLKELTGSHVVFSPDGNRLLLGKGEFNLVGAIGADIYLSSLYLVSVDGLVVEETLLFKATNQTSFSGISWKDNENFVYGRNTYEKPFSDISEGYVDSGWDEESAREWLRIYENPEVSYRVKSIRTGEESMYDGATSAPKELSSLESHSPSREWKIKTIYNDKNEGYRKWEDYIMNEDEGIKIFLDVEEAFWKPTP